MASVKISARIAHTDTVVAPATIDKVIQPLSFSTFFAMRKARVWDVSDGAIAFSFEDGASAYLVEQGNATNFSKPQMTRNVMVEGFEHVSVDVAFQKSDLNHAAAALYCLICDAGGNIVAKQRIACEQGRGRDRFAVPAGAHSLCFALRLARSGVFTPPVFKITREKARKPSAKARPAQTPVEKLMAERRFGTAIRAIQQNDARGDADNILLLKCCTALHEFTRAIEVYEALSPRGQANIPARIHYLRALANLNQAARAQQVIESSAMNLKADKGDIDFLIAAYPFAAFLSPVLAQLVRGRILASAAHLKKSHINQILRCAHDLVSERRFEEFYRLCDTLNTMDLGRDDRARVHILSAQGFYVLGRHEMKLMAVNKALESFYLAPMALKNSEWPFTHSNITCPGAIPQSVRGPLVSVIMTTFNSADTVEYALQSVTDQTYADLEILVADDSSTDRTRDIVARMAEKDPRIRLIALPVNGGTYVAKNHALRDAAGLYATCHDSDDWAHPQKIERTIKPLIDNPALVAVAAQHVRYHPQRGFRGRNGYIQMDAPSLIYRRQDVIERIGFYDSVRAGADTEHQYRMERAFGRQAIKFLPDFLTLFLWSEASLTGGGVFAIDDDAGVFSKPRSAYRQAYMHWHESVDDYRVDFPMTNRAFDIPPEMMP